MLLRIRLVNNAQMTLAGPGAPIIGIVEPPYRSSQPSRTIPRRSGGHIGKSRRTPLTLPGSSLKGIRCRNEDLDGMVQKTAAPKTIDVISGRCAGKMEHTSSSDLKSLRAVKMWNRYGSLIISVEAPDPTIHFPDLGFPSIQKVYKTHRRGEHAERRVCGCCQASSDAASVS